MPAPTLKPCPCQCGLQLLQEDFDRAVAQIEAARAAGKAVPHHDPQPVVQPQPVAPSQQPEATAAAVAEPDSRRFDPYWLRYSGPTHYA